jgi:hypothetical protein
MGLNMPNVTIASTNQTFQNILDEFEDFDRRNYKEPPPKLIKLPDDPVVLACASYRMYLENPRHRWLDFESVIIWQDDREQAEHLKAYYREQFKETTFRMLKNVNHAGLSSFRRKLYQLVNGDLTITDKEIGLLYRLPYFYAEDLSLDSVAAVTKSVPEHLPAHKQVLKLHLFKKILRSRSSKEINQFWFTEETNSHAYMIPISVDNVLENFFDSITYKPLHIEATVFCKQMQGSRDHTYFQIAGPRSI